MNWITSRLSEPTTYIGIAILYAVVTGAGSESVENIAAAIATAVAGGAGLLAVVLKDKANKS